MKKLWPLSCTHVFWVLNCHSLAMTQFCAQRPKVTSQAGHFWQTMEKIFHSVLFFSQISIKSVNSINIGKKNKPKASILMHILLLFLCPFCSKKVLNCSLVFSAKILCRIPRKTSLPHSIIFKKLISWQSTSIERWIKNLSMHTSFTIVFVFKSFQKRFQIGDWFFVWQWGFWLVHIVIHKSQLCECWWVWQALWEVTHSAPLFPLSVQKGQSARNPHFILCATFALVVFHFAIIKLVFLAQSKVATFFCSWQN